LLCINIWLLASFAFAIARSAPLILIPRPWSLVLAKTCKLLLLAMLSRTADALLRRAATGYAILRARAPLLPMLIYGSCCSAIIQAALPPAMLLCGLCYAVLWLCAGILLQAVMLLMWPPLMMVPPLIVVLLLALQLVMVVPLCSWLRCCCL
jgi:hypothetical protein